MQSVDTGFTLLRQSMLKRVHDNPRKTARIPIAQPDIHDGIMMIINKKRALYLGQQAPLRKDLLECYSFEVHVNEHTRRSIKSSHYMVSSFFKRIWVPLFPVGAEGSC